MLIILCGMPGAGKSYCACDLIIKAWKKNPNKRIFTNFPVQWKNKSTMKWTPDLLKKNVFGSLIIIDEAYQDFYSRDWKSFDKDDLLSFATARHSENMYIILSQSLASIDAELRRRGEIWWVSKVALPKKGFLMEYDHWHPLWFTIEKYGNEEDYKMRAMMGRKAVLSKKRILFKKEVAKIYDTHYYGINTENPFTSEPWFKIEQETKKSYKLIPWLTAMLARVTVHQPERFKIGGIYGRLQSFKILEQFRRMLVRVRRIRRTRSPSSLREVLVKNYPLWEPRSFPRTVLYTNWRLWKPIFIALKIEKAK